MTIIAVMVKITAHMNIKTGTSKMSQIKIMTSGHYLLLVLSAAAIMVACVSAASYIDTALAQTNQSSSSPLPSNASPGTTTRQQASLPNSNLSNITGSIPLRTTISEAISSKVKTNLSDAVTIAQKAVGTNTSATLAFIRTLNGYLVYDVHVRNNSNNTNTAVIVDAGNGKVLYRQSPPSLTFGLGFGFDHHDMFGKGKTGKMGPFFGGHRGSGMEGFGGHSGTMDFSPPRW
jgi:hypothetical protein